MDDSKLHIGPLDGKFEYKKTQDGTIDRHEVVCTLCRKEFSFHRSTSSLKYHINAKHSLVGDSSASTSATPGLRQTTLTERRGLSKSTSDKLTDTIAKWIAKNCRPINIYRWAQIQNQMKRCCLTESYTGTEQSLALVCRTVPWSGGQLIQEPMTSWHCWLANISPLLQPPFRVRDCSQSQVTLYIRSGQLYSPVM